MRLAPYICVAAALSLSPRFAAAQQVIDLGVGDSIAIDQPRLLVGISDGVNSYPPSGSYAFTMIADTGASGYLLAAGAHLDLFDPFSPGTPFTYPLAGQYLEQGVGGVQPVDVTAELNFTLADFSGLNLLGTTTPASYNRTGVQALSAPALELGSFDGIVGMPAMQGKRIRVNVGAITSQVDLGAVDPFLFDGVGAIDTIDYIAVTASDTPNAADADPNNNTHPFTFTKFHVDPAAGQLPGGPTPATSDLPILGGINLQSLLPDTTTRRSEGGKFLFDTGAQLSMISSHVAAGLGIDLNDPNLEYLEVGGVGGTAEVPIVQLDRFELTTDEGNTLVFHDVAVGVLDIDGLNDENGQPVAGILGFNLFTTGYLPALLAALGDDTTGALPSADGAIVDLLLDFTGDTWGMQVVTNPDYNPLAIDPELFVDSLAEASGLGALMIPGLTDDPLLRELLGLGSIGTGLSSQALFAWPAGAVAQVPEPQTLPLVILMAAGLCLVGRPRHGRRG